MLGEELKISVRLLFLFSLFLTQNTLLCKLACSVGHRKVATLLFRWISECNLLTGAVDSDGSNHYVYRSEQDWVLKRITKKWQRHRQKSVATVAIFLWTVVLCTPAFIPTLFDICSILRAVFVKLRYTTYRNSMLAFWINSTRDVVQRKSFTGPPGMYVHFSCAHLVRRLERELRVYAAWNPTLSRSCQARMHNSAAWYEKAAVNTRILRNPGAIPHSRPFSLSPLPPSFIPEIREEKVHHVRADSLSVICYYTASGSFAWVLRRSCTRCTFSISCV